MSDQKDAKGTDLDAPTPPGGPTRRDAADAPVSPGEQATDPGPDVDRVTRDPGTNPAVDEKAAQAAASVQGGQSERAADLQEENAETTLDQPSQ